MPKPDMNEKKSVISTDIYAAIYDYTVKVDRYLALTNDNYENEFYYAEEAVKESEKALFKLLRSANRI